MLKSHSVENGKIVLTFGHVGEGIVSSDGEALRWFSVAGDDRKFFWAKAEILGKDRIALESDQVKSPKYARYAWQDNPEGVNFYNSTDLPASPFRTDTQDSEDTSRAHANKPADDGYRLWLKYELIQNAAVRTRMAILFVS